MGKRKYPKGFVAIPFQVRAALSTLTDGTVIKFDCLPSDLGEDLWVNSIKASLVLRGNTATEGPIYVGYAHDDLSVTEISEALAAEQTDPDDIIANERAKRPVRVAGVFHGLSTNEALNDGRPLKTKCRWSEGSGAHRIALWARNQSGATLTGGQIVEAIGTVFGRWQR